MNEIKEELYQSMMIGDLTISSDTSKQILDYIEEKDKEIDRLNNIIDELEKYLENEIRLEMSLDKDIVLRDVFTKLLELKELKGDKDE